MTVYRLAEPVSEECEKELVTLRKVTRTLLFNRGITTRAEADAFLSPDFSLRHDPYLMTDMDRAVERILRAIHQNERIGIWSDYDCDGIPGGVLLHDFFTAIGFTNFENYIPHRHDEGYGLNVAGIDALIERGMTLCITIDCGTTDHKQISHAVSRGVDVIVTDHHEPSDTLPEAYALLNPKRDDAYPFRELCGTGVIWKLVEALLTKGNFSLPKGVEKWWLDVVGIATLADMVSLRGENRILAHYGLAVLRKTRRRGLVELFHVLKIDTRYVTEDDIGFSIAPRVNAASRMGSPEDAFQLFVTTSDADAKKYAETLEGLNSERKVMVALMVKDIKHRLAQREVGAVIVIGNPEWRPSLLGLACNSIVETYGKPAFVWGRDGRDIIKGSCRSDGVVSVVALMHEVRESLIEFGGHHFSGGFAVVEERIHDFPERLESAHAKIKIEDNVVDTTIIDADLSMSEITSTLYQEIASLAPYGVGNSKPLFRFHGVTVGSVMQFGKAKEHLRVSFREASRGLEAISFFSTPDSFEKKLEAGATVDLIAHIEESHFRGRAELRLRIVDVL